ncbi:DUF2637 domain-containing protein [Streptomyces sp. NPDC091278]|uniref:DUF2637 domain-containing protein n=1 Tax=Streptomyces sp. NPDC091278 TaxID=3155301 RepID=UPI00344C50C2
METYPPGLNGHSRPAVPAVPGPAPVPPGPGSAPPVPGSAPAGRAGAPATPGRGQTARMTETLTHDQTPAARVPMAPAAPDVAGAAPVATLAAPAAGESAPPPPRKGGPARPGGSAVGVSTAPATATAAPGRTATPPAETTSQKVLGRLLMAVAVLGMPLVGIIGFAASYANLRSFAVAMGLSDGPFFWSLAPWFPIGIDVSIVALLATDLVMVRRGIPWPVLRFAAHTMTLVTIVFNATADSLTSGKGMWETLAAHPLSAFGHAVMPGLFVLGVEAARKLLMQVARIERGTATDPVPLHRWVLAPVRTARLYRRMRLAAVRSYTDMVEREQALEGYRVWLTQELGGDLSRATEEQRLPLTMAPRGYTVEEALALPAKWREEAEQRKTAADDRKAEADAQETERKADRTIREAETASRVRAAEARAAAAGDLAEVAAGAETAEAEARAEAARVRAETATDTARLQAERARRAAARQAETDAAVLESAEAAAARRRAAEDDRAAAETEAESSAVRAKAVFADRAAALAVEETRRVRAETAAADRAAEEDRAAAEELRRRTAITRAAAADAEAAAEAADDYARLTPRQRNARRVARLLLGARPGVPGGQIPHDAVPLRTIQDRLGVSQTIAGELRHEAADLLQTGYTGPLGDAEAAYEPAAPVS